MTSYTITTTVTTPVFYLNEGDNLTLTSTGTITVGSYVAVSDMGDIGTLTNNGEIDGYGGVTVFGSISNLTNNGVIIGRSSRGVEANFAIGTLTNTGLIEGSQQGIGDFGDLTSFDNGATGTISGGTGLYFYASTGTLVNSGLIEGSSSYGVDSSQGFNDFDNSGTISSTQRTALYSAGNIGTLTNEGTIDGYDGLEAGGSISVLSNSGSITGESTAVSADGIGTLTNSGLIDGNSLGIFDGGSLTSLDNMAGGIITGHTAINAEGGIGTLSNSGTIHGSGSGILAPGTIGTLTNTGSITGYIAINAGAIGTLTNGGTIIGGVYAIGAGSGGLTSLDNDATGALINASQTAIRVNGDIGTLTNAGTITGGITAVNSEGSIGTLTNDGELYGGSEAIFVGSGTLGNLVNETLGTISGGGPAIEVDGTIGTLTNDGTITAYYTAIVDHGTIGTLTNAGTIGSTGILAYGIYSSSGITDLDNSGSISGASEAGVYTGGDIGTLTNEGTISGGDLSAAVYSAGTIGLLSNSGTLISAGGTPIIVDAIGTLDNSGSIEGFVRVNGDVTVLDNKTDGSINGLLVGGTIDTLMNDGTLVGGNDYIEAGAIGTLTNSGNIDGSGVASGTLIQDYGNLTDLDNKLGATISCNSGIALFVDGTVGTLTNEGFIGSSFVGVIDVLGDIDDFYNSGTISGGSYTAAAIISRGTIEVLTNEGSILSQAAGISASAADTIINSGVISANGSAISVGSSLGTLSNAGTIDGGSYGIIASSVGTIENAGTIIGGTDAIYVSSAGGTLILDPTSVIDGTVAFNQGTLELAGSTPNDVTGIGDQYTGFTSIVFDNAHATAEGSTGGLAGGELITGFTYGDKIVLDGFAAVSETFSPGGKGNPPPGLVLTDANSNTEVLYLSGAYSTADFMVTNDGTNTTITEIEPLCFLPGTLILTPGGEVPVEDLRVGDLVVTLDGRGRPIRWIGHGRLLAPAGRRGPATPVVIRRGALADNVPHRDLHVTKGHALYLHGVFIPAEFLVNHRSIQWDDRGQEVTFYHVELGGHEVLRANGAPVESYRDEGNRWMFANSNPAWDQPGVAPFAPVLTGGRRVDVVWRELLDRSGIDLTLPTTTDPDLHLLVDGARVEGRRLSDEVYGFTVPAGARRVAIASRASAPDVLGVFRDPRRLGVAVSRIVLSRKGAPLVIDASSDSLTDGFHAYEPGEGCRWTNGYGVLPADALPGASEPRALLLYIRHTARYAAPGDAAEAPQRLRA